MIADAWFRHEGRWHVHAEGNKARCGLELLDPPTIVRPTEEDGPPPDPCTRCILQVGMDFVEDEPLERAKSRGYLPVDFDSDPA